MTLVRWMTIAVVLVFISTAALAQVLVSLPDTTANWNSTVTIPIRVSDVSAYAIYSYEFILNYNALVLTPISVDQNNTIASGWQKPEMNDSTKGMLVVGGYGANKLVGSGRLVNITFQVIGQPDQVSDLTFSYFAFNIGTPSASLTNGKVKVIANLVAVTITTDVLNGTEVVVDGRSYPAPYQTYWEKGSSHQISAPATQTMGDRRYLFQSWSDQGAQTHTVSVTQPTTFTAKYGTQYLLTIQSAHGTPQGGGWYNAGASANFSIDSAIVEHGDTKYLFLSWTGSGTGSYTGPSRQASVVMNGPIIETANWTTRYYVDVRSDVGAPYGSGWYSPGTLVTFGMDSSAFIRPDVHHRFRSWTGTGPNSYTGTNLTATITVVGPVIEQAVWDTEFLLITGSLPDGLLQVPGGGWYAKGQTFTTIQAPDPLIVNQVSYRFKGWKVNEAIVPGNPVTVVMDGPKTVIADYSTDITVVITTNIGAGTKVIVDGEEKNAPCIAQWIAGTRHSIGVVNVQNGAPGVRYSYVRWSHGGSQTQEVIPTINTTYTAELATQYYLDVKDEPVGIVNPKGSGWFAAGQRVTLDSLIQNKIVGQTSYRFIKWRVDGVDSMKKSVVLLMEKPRQAVAIYQKGFYISGTITFVGSDPVPLTIELSGAESFAVQSDSNGNYVIAGLVTGDYVVRPRRAGFIIEPIQRTYKVNRNFDNEYYIAFYTTAISSPETSGQSPDQYELYQNYPNPLSEMTQIEYALNKRVPIQITVYNVLGQEIARLVDGEQPAGRHRVQWNRTDVKGARVPSGVYFYRIEAGAFVQIKKMIVL